MAQINIKYCRGLELEHKPDHGSPDKDDYLVKEKLLNIEKATKNTN
ncbi:MAG TPA: hypothetical protein VLB50_12795 [Ignavibacteriaceae bacterium]|nr:hypothetical protein [Ignavibacteriaceae bacterium]